MPLHHISVVIEPGLHIHFRGLFSSITPHVAAAVIPPSDMSSKTSSGVPIVVILATLVLVLVTVVALCRTLASVRCDGHHKWSDCYRARQWQLAAVASTNKSLA
jgi:hypothetical protein